MNNNINIILIFIIVFLLILLLIYLYLFLKNRKQLNEIKTKFENVKNDNLKFKTKIDEIINKNNYLEAENSEIIEKSKLLEEKMALSEKKNAEKQKSFDERQTKLDLEEQNLITQQQDFHKSVREEQEKISAKMTELADTKCKLQQEHFELNNERNDFENLKSQELLKIAQLTKDEAFDKVIQDVRNTKRAEISKELESFEQRLILDKKNLAQNILLNALENIETEKVNDNFSKVIKLPSESYKGRLIGRDGRNINLLENLLGVNIIIDETPEQIVVSSFNPLRRAVATISLERLINSGKINQVEIENTVEIVQKEVDDLVLEKGKNAFQMFEIYDIDLFLIKKVGTLFFRTSLGQNVYEHSIEAAKIAQSIATQLGVDPQMAARATLLHDVGKVDSEETGNSHVTLGVMYAQQAGEPEEVINAIHAHHGEVEPNNIYAIITQIADRISASQLGARRDTYEAFIQRVEALESIALNIDGIDKAYALKGGKELRVIVQASKVPDSELKAIAHEIKKEIENSLTIPAGITINILRENRYIINAKNKVNKDKTNGQKRL